MHIGIPKERRPEEYRVSLTPAGVEMLTQAGHTVWVESGAGLGAGFTDEDYRRAGAQIVYSGPEVYGRADLVVKVARPTQEEFEWLREGQALMGFLHLAAARRDKIEILLRRRITAIAYETVQADDGSLPILAPISAIAGRMAAHVAATLLQNDRGGKGILLGGAPGVPPAEVVILGAGVVGSNAARAFAGMGASVYVLDKDIRRLQRLEELCGSQVITMVSHPYNLRKVVRFADVLIGAVLVPGARTPILVTREMVRAMKPRSLIMDISIDQGGCVETSRPTTHRDPTFVEEGVIHYAVPNMTGVLGRTATHALTNALWPFLEEIARVGLEEALDRDPALARGVNTREGRVTHPELARVLEMEASIRQG
ncbi:MAG: alanine dehydrogenase [Thermoflexus sp.]|jgi:alanine dehydrogenase|uniref:alanine dehydrogenase n=1 Tax=Thermoflexus TaxID=1495649 RepID=UPI001C77D08B|nr:MULTISPECIES: alanine dehydrogenase [Thermoflexus]MDT7883269.1 alanine dehydrogenase [Thermoflexus sp.]MDT7946719.1 alanine dehydrogenase [Thermoflexus sp.]QWK09638.1 MAG: alanine dehydrogenase [Thermoflexus hugenholtzii]